MGHNSTDQEVEGGNEAEQLGSLISKTNNKL